MSAIASQITSLTIVYSGNCLFRRRSKKTSKLRVIGLCVGNSSGTGEFPAQMDSNAENASIWWRHHEQTFNNALYVGKLEENQWNVYRNVLINALLVGLCIDQFIHYCDVIMGPMASQITSLTIVYSTVYWGADQRIHQSSASLAFVWGIHRRSVNSPHKWPVTRKMFPFDDVIMRSAF